MKGAIIGDIIGSVYEFKNIKTKEFPLFQEDCFFTDDTVLTVAVADALLTRRHSLTRDAVVAAEIQKQLLRYGRGFPHRGYGGAFRKWLGERYPKPYYSCGNGSAMRVSAVAYVAQSLEDCERLAKLSAEVTHDHPDGICGAQATAGAVYLALHGGSKEDITRYVEQYYDWDFCLDEIRPEYRFDHFAATCEGTVPYAVEAFIESTDFEDAIRNVVSIGGDTDTLGAITGAIAEAYYGVPDDLWDQARLYLDFALREKVDTFYATFIDDQEYPEPDRKSGKRHKCRLGTASSVHKDRSSTDGRRRAPMTRRYAKDDPAYEDIRCVYLALPGAMGDEACASVVAIGPDGAEWRDYDLWTTEEEKHFGEVFPPFAQDSYDIAIEAPVPNFRKLYLCHGHTLLVHESIYPSLSRYEQACRPKRGRKQEHRFRWWDHLEYLLRPQNEENEE